MLCISSRVNAVAHCMLAKHADVKPVQCNNKKLYSLKKTGVNQMIIIMI